MPWAVSQASAAWACAGLRGLGVAGIGGIGGLAGAGGLGGLGGVGGIAGLGGQGFQQLVPAATPAGRFPGQFQGRGNLGNGGIAGFGGQQLGQFGNLGGQFGLQGGNQERDPHHPHPPGSRQAQGLGRQLRSRHGPALNPLDEDGPRGRFESGEQPARLLSARAGAGRQSQLDHPHAAEQSRHQSRHGGTGPIPNRDPKVRVAGAGDERADLDPKKVWQDALTKGINNPSLIIATADFLVLTKKFEHAVEFLKANLRQGIVVEPWVYKSLALALRMSGGSAEDIERAEVSTADMRTEERPGYLRRRTALAHDEKYGLALAFCRQAALLEPGTPHAYEEALNYAELGRDPKAMEWAAGNLLRHDWPVENRQLQARALQKIDALVKLLDQQGRKEESEKLKNTVSGPRPRSGHQDQLAGRRRSRSARARTDRQHVFAAAPTDDRRRRLDWRYAGRHDQRKLPRRGRLRRRVRDRDREESGAIRSTTRPS